MPETVVSSGRRTPELPDRYPAHGGGLLVDTDRVQSSCHEGGRRVNGAVRLVEVHTSPWLKTQDISVPDS